MVGCTYYYVNENICQEVLATEPKSELLKEAVTESAKGKCRKGR